MLGYVAACVQLGSGARLGDIFRTYWTQEHPAQPRTSTCRCRCTDSWHISESVDIPYADNFIVGWWNPQPPWLRARKWIVDLRMPFALVAVPICEIKAPLVDYAPIGDVIEVEKTDAETTWPENSDPSVQVERLRRKRYSLSSQPNRRPRNYASRCDSKRTNELSESLWWNKLDYAKGMITVYFPGAEKHDPESSSLFSCVTEGKRVLNEDYRWFSLTDGIVYRTTEGWLKRRRARTGPWWTKSRPSLVPQWSFHFASGSNNAEKMSNESGAYCVLEIMIHAFDM